MEIIAFIEKSVLKVQRLRSDKNYRAVILSIVIQNINEFICKHEISSIFFSFLVLHYERFKSYFIKYLKEYYLGSKYKAT